MIERTAPRALLGSAPTEEETEAYQALLLRVRRKSGAIAADLLVRHVLAITRGASWPVQREAMEALLRRYASSQSDRLRIAARPAGKAVFGVYATRREGSKARPYRTLLLQVDPPRGSCDCPDYLRSSLGLCKHLLVILENLALKASVLAGAQLDRPGLTWDPVRPLTGRGDWLERIRWTGGTPTATARRWFRRRENGEWVLPDAHAERPARRLELVGDLLRLGGGGRGDPAVGALLSNERAKLQRSIAGADGIKAFRSALRTLKQKLYPYQLEGVERYLARGRLLLADDMGLGKTAQAIAACHALFSAGKVRRGLIVVPASLKSQWLREWQSFSDTEATIVDGNPAQRRQAFASCKSGFLIVNYEQLLRDLDVMHRWKPDIIVLDEAQRIKNWATKTALYVKKLQPAYRLVLTGTPMENRIEELASIVEWVDDFALEPKWRLAPLHTASVDGKPEVGGARELDTLRCRLEDCMVRRLRKGVLGQLPARTDTRVPIELTVEQRAEHDELNQPIAQLTSMAKKRPLTQAQFLRLMSLLTTQRIISNGLAQLRFAEIWPTLSAVARPAETTLRGLFSPKLLELRELIAEVAVSQERKVVVFSQWRRMLKLAHWSVKPLLDDCGARAVFFTGEEPQQRRTHNIVDFHDDPSTRVLFASDAGGVGLNLQRAASCCINLELPWNPAVLEQRIGRIYRLGQKRPIDVYNLICEEGIESRIAGLVGNKKALFDGLFDGCSNEISFEGSGSFLSRLEKIVELPQVPVLQEVDESDVEGLVVADACDSEIAEQKEVPLPSAAEVQRLFSQLRIRAKDNGGIVIEAEPEAASMLCALFEGMGRMLSQASGPRGPADPSI